MPVVRIRRRESAAADQPEWEFEVRPQRSRRTAVIVAIVLVVGFGLAGVFLRTGDTGVQFRVVDQYAIAAVGVFLAGAVLLLTRPRVRAGAHGVVVRNVLGDNHFDWDHVRGVSFPDRKAWARLELPHDEYIPMLAIRAGDKTYAADALDRLRALGAKYSPPPEPPVLEKPHAAVDTKDTRTGTRKGTETSGPQDD